MTRGLEEEDELSLLHLQCMEENPELGDFVLPRASVT